MERRLAAILAADVVGYTRLMGDDEAGTLSRFTKLRGEDLEPLIADHRGRIVKLMGDGLLVEFPSIVDAVSCAIAWQNVVFERETATDENKRLQFRIGINLGDVIVEGEDIHGDGVNIAARLESLAEPSGICLSDDAYRQVRGKIEAEFEDLGERDLKNVAEPIRVYRIATAGSIASAGSGSADALPLPHKPSIAVLPFKNMSSDPEQEYFSDGITEDIITELSRFSEFNVIARNSTFHYKGKSPKIRDVGRELGARFVVEGSVRRSGNRVRITAQLIDVDSDAHVWAERYDRELVDIFDLQDELTQAIVGVLPGRVEVVEANRVKRKPPSDMAAYDFLLAGKIHHHRFTKEDNEKAMNYLERATELEPDYAAAYAWKACVLGQAMARGYRSDLEAAFQEVLVAVQKAMALDENDQECLRVCAEIAMEHNQLDKAQQYNERALRLNPNHPLLVAQKGELYTWMGDSVEGAQWVRRAMRLDPYSAPSWAHLLGRSLMLSDDYEAAIEAYRQSSTPRVGHHADRAACYTQLGQAKEAELEVAEALKLKPDFSISVHMKTQYHKSLKDRRRHHELLRATGLPE